MGVHRRGNLTIHGGRVDTLYGHAAGAALGSPAAAALVPTANTAAARHDTECAIACAGTAAREEPRCDWRDERQTRIFINWCRWSYAQWDSMVSPAVSANAGSHLDDGVCGRRWQYSPASKSAAATWPSRAFVGEGLLVSLDEEIPLGVMSTMGRSYAFPG